jgi:hypothetical protein
MKRCIVILVLIFLISLAYAQQEIQSFAQLCSGDYKGVMMKFGTPAMQDALDLEYKAQEAALCVSTPSSCISGKVKQEAMNKVMSAALNALSRVFPQIGPAVQTYNSINSLMSATKTIGKGCLKVNEKGYMDSGTLYFENAQINAENINFTYDKNSGTSTFGFEKEGSLTIGGYDFKNVGSYYDPDENAEKQGFVQTDSKGNIIKARFKVNEKGGTYSFPGVNPVTAANVDVSYECAGEGAEKTCSAKILGDAGNNIQFEGKDIKLSGSEIKVSKNEISSDGRFDISDKTTLGTLKVELSGETKSAGHHTAKIVIEDNGYNVMPNTIVSMENNLEIKNLERSGLYGLVESNDVFITSDVYVDEKKHPDYIIFTEFNGEKRLEMNGIIETTIPANAQWNPYGVAAKNDASFTLDGGRVVVTEDYFMSVDKEGKTHYSSGSADIEFKENNVLGAPIVMEKKNALPSVIDYSGRYQLNIGEDSAIKASYCTTSVSKSLAGQTIYSIAAKAITGETILEDIALVCGKKEELANWVPYQTDEKLKTAVRQKTLPSLEKEGEGTVFFELSQFPAKGKIKGNLIAKEDNKITIKTSDGDKDVYFVLRGKKEGKLVYDAYTEVSSKKENGVVKFAEGITDMPSYPGSSEALKTQTTANYESVFNPPAPVVELEPAPHLTRADLYPAVEGLNVRWIDSNTGRDVIKLSDGTYAYKKE